VCAPFERDGASGLLRKFQHLLARTQLFFRALAFGDIAEDANDALRNPLRVAKDLPSGTDPA
jgi:hypothetical protein